MPEEQNIHADQWNRRLNSFLRDVLKWKQLGESNNDVYCEELKRKVEEKLGVSPRKGFRVIEEWIEADNPKILQSEGVAK